MLVRVAIGTAAIGVGGFGVVGAAQAQVVTNVNPDGRTATNAIANGAITTVTTNTISSGNALNSFSVFDVGIGATVNLVVPDNAHALINIVRDKAVAIDGVVNSLQHGGIGGNVFFADPHGFVIGKTGSINVGSLTVSTPTTAFLDTVLDAHGGIGAAALASLLAGDMPLSSDGTISIHGAVRSGYGVTLRGQTVSAGGIITAGLAGHEAVFAQTVNSGALVEANRLIETNGRIEIVATDTVALGGTVAVAAGATGAAIAVRAGNDITIGGGTTLSANAAGVGDGGTITVLAGRDLTVADGLSVVARGGVQAGNGGSVELSAKRKETLGGARYDLTAANGATGSLLFDPSVLDITVSQTTLGAAVAMSADATLHLFGGVSIDTTNGTGQAGAITLNAPNITLDGILNAGSGATGGTVLIDAALTSTLAATAFGTSGHPTVSITQTADSVISGGAVTLAASATSTADRGIVGADATIAIGGRINGSSVTITSDAAATTHKNASLGEVFSDAAQAIASLSDISYIQDAATAIGSAAVPLDSIGFAQAKATAGVSILNGATVTAGVGGVVLRSIASQTIDQTSTNGTVLGVVVAKIGGGATTDVASGARITSDGKLELGAHDVASGTLSISATSKSGEPDLTVAVLTSDIGASAIVHSGALLSVAGNLAIVGRNDTNYDTEATATAAADGSVGVAAALAFTTANATALLGASVGATGTMPTTVLVEADSVGANSIVKGSSKTGGSAPAQAKGVKDWTSLTDQLQGALLEKYLGALMSSASASGASPKLSSALAVNDSTTITRAEIAPTDGAITVPTVKTGNAGTVAVIANRVDGGITDFASSAIEAKGTKDGVSYAVSAAIAVGLRDDTTLALIAPKAVVTAGKVAVQANLTVPKPYAWANPLLSGSFDISTAFSDGMIDGLKSIYDDIKDITEPSTFATGFAEAKGQASSGSVNGVVNYFGRTGSTTAWVGNGAKITATDATGNAGWQITADGGDAALLPTYAIASGATGWVPAGANALASPDGNGVLPTFTFAKSLTIGATSDAGTFFLSGDRSAIKDAPAAGSGGAASGASSGGASQSVAVGGVVNMVDVTNTTIAGVAADARITSAGDLMVAATSSTSTYLIDPGAGTGGSIGVTGVVALSTLTETTHASIANSAAVSAQVVSVLATQGINVWTGSGAISTGTAAGVGLSVAVNAIDTDTSAIVGDNAADAAIAAAADALASTSNSGGTGTIGANTLTVHANTFGQAGSLAVGLAKAGTGSPGGLSSLISGAKGKYAAISSSIDAVKAKLDPLLNPISTLLDQAGSSAASGGKAQTVDSTKPTDATSSGAKQTESARKGFSIGVAGAAAVGLYNANTTASVGHVTLNPFAGGASIVTDVLATRNASFFTLAGGASKVGSGGGKGGSSVGVAGALALTEDRGNTLAALVSVTAAKAGATSVQALTGGLTVGAALSAAVDTDQNSAAVAASGTLSFLHGATNADVSGSTLTGIDTADFRVRGYNSTQVGLGAGALFFGGGKAGLGATLTLSLVGDSTAVDPVTGLPYSFVGAHLADTVATRFAHVGVAAEAPIRLISAAITGGVTKDPNGLSIALGGIYADIGRSLSATVVNSTLTATATDTTALACGDETCGILVIAGADRSAALDALIGDPTAGDSAVDFAAADASSVLGDHATGAGIISVAGIVQAGGSAAGLEFVGGTIHDQYVASVTGSKLTATHSDIAVLTHDAAYIGSLSLGVAIARGSSGVGFLGSSTVNLISSSNTASITGSTSSVTGKAVTVAATSSAAIDSMAGNVVGSKGTAIGVAIGFNQINRTIASSIAGFTVDTATLAVTAEAAGHIRTASVSGALAVGSGPAIAGSFTINNLADTVSATLGANALVRDASGYTTVSATNSGRIDALAGSVAISTGSAGVGAAVAVNLLAGSTTASVNGATVLSADLDVLAKATGNIGVIAIGAGVGQSAGVGGSIVTNILSQATTAKIAGNAVVSAANSVSVQAGNANGVYVSSGALGGGSSAGVGLGVATNILGATSTALVDHSSVTAGGAGAGRSVSDGTLVTAIDTAALMCLGSSCDHDTDKQTYSNLFIAHNGDATDPVTQMGALAYHTKVVKGLSVNATTTQNVAILSAAVGVAGTAAFAADVGTSIVSGTTAATISASTIDGAAGAHGAVDVLAGGLTVVGNIIAGVAGSGSVAGAGAVAAVSFQQTVIADIADSAIAKPGAQAAAVSATALGTQQSFGITAGAAVSGSLAFAGSGLVNLFSSTTTASVRGGEINARSLTVNADTIDSVGGAVGAIAVGFGGGAGAGAFNVTYMRDTTVAVVGDSTADTPKLALNLSGDLTIHAEGHDRFAGLAISGAGSVGVGISGLANVLYSDSSVRAGLYNAIVAPGAGAVKVTSLIDTTMHQVGGALGVGITGAGVGIALNLVIVKDAATSEIVGSTLNAASVDVTADKTRTISATTLSAGAGFGGVGGAINLALIGTLGANGLSDSDSGNLGSSSALNGMIGNSDSLAESDLSGNNSSLSAAQKVTATTATGFHVTSALTSATAASTTARIVGSNVTTSALNVLGTVASSTSATVGAAGVGALGVGGAVGFTRLRDSVAATTDSTTTLHAPVIRIAAVTKDGAGGGSAVVDAYAGAAGVVGLGAAVADVDVQNVLTASAAGSVIGLGTSGSLISVTATDSTTQTATSAGASIGAAAAGLSAAVVNRASTIVARFDADTFVDQFETLSITATDGGSATALSYAAAGGVGVAVSGTVATAIDASLITAQINGGSISNIGSAGLTIAATAKTGLSAEANGVAVSGGVGIGVSVATAIANQSVHALDDGAAHGGDGFLMIKAALATPTAISAVARAAAGGVLGAGQASVAYARNTAHVDAALNNNDTQPTSSRGVALTDGNISVLATNANAVSADAEGVVLGFYAAGAVVADATADSVTTASIGASSGDQAQWRSGTLTVQATSTDTTSAFALSGSGGVVAGAAASATTHNVSQTTASVGARPLTGSVITIGATHTAYYAGAADAKQAAVAGASAAIVDNTVAATTTAIVAGGPVLTAADMHIAALNSYFNATLPHSAAYSGVGGAGGLANIGAVAVTSTLGGTAKVAIGDGAQLYVVGDPIAILSAGASNGLYIDAATKAATSDAGTLELAGGFQGPYVATTVNAVYTNQIDIGSGTGAKTLLYSDGRIGIGAQSFAQQAASADVTVYGLAGIGGGKTNISVTSNQLVTIAGNADLLSYGQTTIGAGVTSDGGTANLINARADTHVFNNTLIPITAILDANATSSSINTLTIANAARVRSVLDVALTAAQGDVQAAGAYVGTNPYLTLFSSDTTGGNSTASGTGNLLLGGQVTAGVAHIQSLTQSNAGFTASSSLNDDDTPTRFFPAGSFGIFDPLPNISARLTTLNGALSGATPEERNSINGEITLLQALYSDLSNMGAGNGMYTVATSPIYAASGDIIINAAKIAKIANSGAALHAQGDASVTITNQIGASLLVGQIYMPTSGLGVVKYLGTGTAQGLGIAVTQSTSGMAPQLLVQNTQDSNAPGSSGAGTSIFLNGDIYNPLGSTTITNLSGSIAQFAKITTAQLTMNAPNGSFFVNQAGIWNQVDPASQWSILPVTAFHNADGSVNTSRTTGNAFGIVDYATNYLYNRDGSLSTDQLARKLIGNGIDNVIAVGLIPNNRNDDNDSGYTHGVGGNLPFRVGGSGDNQYLHYYGPYGRDSWYLLFSAPLSVSIKKVAAASDENSRGALASGIDVGRSVIINADTININAGITAGHATTQSIALGNNVQAYIDRYTAYLQSGQSGSSAFTIVNGLLSLDGFTGTGTGVIRAGYDARDVIAQNGTTVANPNKGKIVLANVDASGGGSITLNGHIINTDGNTGANALGQLNVRSGLGQVSIVNLTSTPVVVGAIATGTGDQDGVIKITDRSFTNDQGGALTRWWVNPQGTSQVLQYSNKASGGTDLSAAQLVGSSNDRASSYTPLQNLRYTWQDQYDATRSLNFGGTDWTGVSTTAWITNGANNQDYVRGAAYLTTGSGSDPFFVSQVTDASLQTRTYTVNWHHYAYEKGGDLTAAKYAVAVRADVTVTNSIKADNPIGIHFFGNNSANVGIYSVGNVYLGGGIADAKGQLSITSVDGGIFGSSGSTATASGYAFTAATAIGTATQAINLASVTGTAPTLKAVSGAGGINIANLSGDITVGLLSAGTGDVTLASAGSIRALPAGAGTNVSANTVTLASTNGSIGSAASPLTIVARTVNATANGDIALTQQTGNLVAGNIVSKLGQIALIANNGTVVGGAPTAAAATAQSTTDQALWSKLGLTSSTAGVSAVTQYQNSINAAYQRYWNVQNLLDPASSGTALTAAGRALFRGQAALILAVPDPTTLSAADIDRTILGLRDSARTELIAALGSNFGALTTQQDQFAFVLAATDPHYAELTSGARWTVGQLSNTIGGGTALSTGPNLQALTGISITSNNVPTTPTNLTVIVGQAANIPSGRLAGPVSNLGVATDHTTYFVVTGPSNAGYYTSDTDPDTAHYTTSQVRTLLAVQGLGATHTTIDGDTVKFTLGNAATISTKTQSGTTNVVSSADFHLDMTGDISLTALTSNVLGTLFVNSTDGNIINGTAGHITTVGGLSLSAGGYAGTDDAPLLFNAVNPAAPLRILNITAGGGVSIKVLNAGILLGDTTFTGTATIAAAGSIGGYNGLNGAVTIAGSGGLLTLDTTLGATPSPTTTIGTSASPFTILDVDHTAIALVTNAATLAAPMVTPAGTLANPTPAAIGGSLTLAASTIANSLSVVAADAIEWRAADTGALTAASIDLQAGGGIGASGPLRLATTMGNIVSDGHGDVALAFVGSASTPVSLTGLVAAGGALTVNSTSALNAGGVSAAGEISLTTSNGDIRATNIASDTGAIVFDSAGGFAANIVSAPGAITGHARDTISLTTASSDGWLALTSRIGAITATHQLTGATGVSLTASGGGIGGGAAIDTFGSATLRGAGIAIGAASAGTLFDAQSTGALSLANGTAEGFILLGSTVNYGDLTAGDSDSVITSAGTIVGGGFNSDAALSLKGASFAASGLSGTTVGLTVAGDATVQNVRGSGDVTLAVGSATIDTATAGGVLAITSQGGLSIGTGSGDSMALRAASLTFTQLGVFQALTATIDGAIAGGKIVQAGPVTLTGTTVTLDELTGESAVIKASGRFTAGKLLTSGDASIMAAGITLGFVAPVPVGPVDPGSAGDGAGPGSPATIAVPISAARLALASTGDITLGSDAMVGNLIGSAGSTIDFTGHILTATAGDIDLTAAGAIQGGMTTTAASTRLASDWLVLDTVKTGDLRAELGTGGSIGTLIATGDATVTAGRTITLTTGTIGGTFAATANGVGASLTLGTASAKDMALLSGGGLTFQALVGTRSFQATAQGILQGTDLGGFATNTLNAGALALTTFGGGTIQATTAGMTQIEALTATGDATLRGGSLAVTQTDVSGLFGATSTSRDITLRDATAQAMTLSSAGNLMFTTLTGGGGALSATAVGALSGTRIIGFDDVGLNGATLRLTTLAGGSLALTTTGAAVIDAATVTHDAVVRVGSLWNAGFAAGGAFTATTLAGDATLTDVTAHAATLTVAGDLLFSTLTGRGGDLVVDATGAVAGTRVTGFGVNHIGGGSLALQALEGASLDSTTWDATGIERLVTSGAAALSGGSIAVTTATVGGLFGATSTSGDITLRDATAQAMTLSSAGNLMFTTLTGGGGALSATAVGALSGTRIIGFDDVELNGVTLRLTTLAGGSFALTTTGAAVIDAATVTHDAVVRVGSLWNAGFAAGGAFTATTLAGDATLTDVTAHAATLTVAGDLLFSTLTGRGGDLVVDATGAVAGTSVTGFGVNHFGSASLAFETLDGTSIDSRTDEATKIRAIDVSGAAHFGAGTLDLATVTAGSDLSATTTRGDLVLGGARAVSMTFQGAHDIRFASLIGNGGRLSAVARNAVVGGSISGFGETAIEGATLAFDTLDATTAALTATGAVTIATLRTTGDFAVKAASIAVTGATIGGAITATTSAGDIVLGTARMRSATLTSARDLTFGTLSGGGDAFVATVVGATQGDSLTGFAFNRIAAGSLQLATITGGALDVATSGPLSIGTAALTGDATLAGSSIALTTLTAPTLVATSTAGDIRIGEADAASMTLTASGNLGVTTLIGSGGALVATSTGGLTGATIDGFGANRFNAASIDLSSVSGGSVAGVSTGTTTIGTLTVATDAMLRASALSVTHARIGNALTATSLLGGIILGDAITRTAGLTSSDGLAYGSLTGVGPLSLMAVGAAQGGTLTGFDSADLRAGTATLTTVDVGTALALTANTIVIGSARAGTASFGSVGLFKIDDLTVRDAATLSAGSALLGTIESGGALALTIGTTLDATTLRSRDLAITSGGATRLGTATAAGTFTSATQDLTASTLIAGGAERLTGRDITIGTTRVGGALTVDARTLQVGMSDAASSAWTASGSIGFGQTTSSGATYLIAAGDVRGTTLTSGSDVVVSGATVTVDRVAAGTLAQVTAIGAMTLGTVTVAPFAPSPSSVSAQSGVLRSLAITPGRLNLLAGGAIQAHALVSTGSIVVAANRFTIGSATAAGDVTGQATTGLVLTNGQAGGALMLIANGSDIVSTALRSGTDSTLSAAGGITLTDATAGTTAALVAGRDITLSTLSTGGNAAVSAGGSISVTTVRSGGRASLAATGDLISTTLGVADALRLTGRSIRFDTIDAASLTASTAAAMAGRRITVAGDVTITPLAGGTSSIAIGGLTAITASLTASRGSSAGAPAIQLGSAAIGQRLALFGSSADVGLTGTGTALALSLEGYDGARMANAVVRISSAAPLAITRLVVSDAVVSTAGSSVTISDAIADRFSLSTADLSVLVDNRSPRLSGRYSAQYFAPNERFTFDVVGLSLTGPLAPLWTDSAAGVHLAGPGGFISGSTAAAQLVERGDHLQLRLRPRPPRVAEHDAIPDPVQSPGGGAVNLSR